jgi:hypothetical protein
MKISRKVLRNKYYIYIILLIGIILVVSYINIKEGFDFFEKKKIYPKDLSGNIIASDLSGNLMPEVLSGITLLQCGDSSGNSPPFYRFADNSFYKFPPRNELKSQLNLSDPSNKNIRTMLDNLMLSQPVEQRNNFHTYWFKDKNDCNKYLQKYHVMNK